MADDQTQQYHEGAEVLSADGTKLGDIERLVVDPSRRAVTHLVVSKGFFFPEQRIVPIDIVESSTADAVHLLESVDARDLPIFENEHYVTADSQAASPFARESSAAPLIWSYPAYAAVPSYGIPPYPTYAMNRPKTVERNVPDGSTVVAVGTAVFTADGDDIGEVSAAHTAEDGTLSAFEVDPGWFKAEQLIPAHFVDLIEEDRVVLAVGRATLEQLQP